MKPAPRDPRMERPEEQREAGANWSVMLVPVGNAESTRRIDISAKQFSRLRSALFVLAALMVAPWILVAVFLSGAVGSGELIDENLMLKVELQAIDSDLDEVSALLERLRLYSAQVHALSEATGPHGGPVNTLPDDMLSGTGLFEMFEGLNLDLPDESLASLSFQPEPAGGWVETADLRPAEAWARAVQSRSEGLHSMLSVVETDVNRLVEELEDLRALEAALPKVWPTKGRLTSGFGWRHNPFGRAWKFHSGIDIANSRGAPIRAPSSGRVIMVTTNGGGYGRMLEVDHGFGITTVYGHLNSIRVKKGQAVERGDVIATVGNTGQSTGPHLHFELRADGYPVNPLDYLPR
jgi:murein DD-endopeptidase MepM/ murein hydrolase activator NlpD